MDNSETKTTWTVGNFFRSLACIFLFGAQPAVAQSVTLAWTASDNPVVAGYKIYYGTTSRDYASAVAVGDVTSAVMPGLVAGQTYYFAVTTCDAAGNESTFSDEIIFAVPVPVRARAVSSASLVTAGPLPTQPSTSNGPRPATVSYKTAANEPVPAAAANLQTEVSAKQSVPDTALTAAEIPASAKAQVVRPENISKSNGLNQALALSADLPPAPEANAPPVADVKIPATADCARLFYAAASPFDANADGRLDDDELAVLTGAMLDELEVLFAADQLDDLPLLTAPDATTWCAALYALLAPFDANRDGELQPDELTALAAALDADNVAAQNFAPPLPVRGEDQNADCERVDPPADAICDHAAANNFPGSSAGL
jgi:hypothetical protein